MQHKSTGCLEVYGKEETDYVHFKEAWFHITNRGLISMWARGNGADLRFVAPLDSTIRTKSIHYETVEWDAGFYRISKKNSDSACLLMLHCVDNINTLTINFKTLDVMGGKASITLVANGSMGDHDPLFSSPVEVEGSVIFKQAIQSAEETEG